MAASLSASSNPGNVLLATMPFGGTRPITDAIGKVGSAASSGCVAVKSAAAASTIAVRSWQALLVGVMLCLRRSRTKPRAVGSRPCDPAQSQIDPAALGQKGRGAAFDAIDAVKGQPATAAKNQGVAGAEPERPGRIAPPLAADPEQTGIAE